MTLGRCKHMGFSVGVCVSEVAMPSTWCDGTHRWGHCFWTSTSSLPLASSLREQVLSVAALGFPVHPLLTPPDTGRDSESHTLNAFPQARNLSERSGSCFLWPTFLSSCFWCPPSPFLPVSLFLSLCLSGRSFLICSLSQPFPFAFMTLKLWRPGCKDIREDMALRAWLCPQRRGARMCHLPKLLKACVCVCSKHLIPLLI